MASPFKTLTLLLSLLIILVDSKIYISSKKRSRSIKKPAGSYEEKQKALTIPKTRNNVRALRKNIF